MASGLIARGEDEHARKLIATMTNLMVLVVAPLAAVSWLLAPVLVPLITPGYTPAEMEMTIWLTRLMLLSPILLAVGAVMAAGLNSHGIFGAPALAPNVYNIAIIAAAIVLTPFLGISALAVGVVLGAFGHVLTQALPFVRNRLYEPLMDLHDPAVRETLMLMGPRALGLGATQLVFVVLMIFTTTMPEGDVSRFRSVFIALQIPVGLIGVPLGIVLLPPLSQAFALGQHDRFKQLVDQSLRLLLFVTIPMTGLMLALAAPTIALLFQYGKVDASASAAMVPVYIVFLLGLIAHVMIALLAPIFYAGKDTRTPVTAALLAVAVDIGAAVVLFPFFHLQGLAPRHRPGGMGRGDHARGSHGEADRLRSAPAAASLRLVRGRRMRGLCGGLSNRALHRSSTPAGRRRSSPGSRSWSRRVWWASRSTSPGRASSGCRNWRRPSGWRTLAAGGGRNQPKPGNSLTPQPTRAGRHYERGAQAAPSGRPGATRGPGAPGSRQRREWQNATGVGGRRVGVGAGVGVAGGVGTVSVSGHPACRCGRRVSASAPAWAWVSACRRWADGGGVPVFCVQDVVGGNGAPHVCPNGVQNPTW